MFHPAFKMRSEGDNTGFNGMMSPELVLSDLLATSRDEVLREMASHLVTSGCCADSFVQAILDREREHPSGLPMPGGNLAIPHTDTDHVLRSGFLFARLQKPVSFFMMGRPDQELEVSLVVMFALQDTSLAGKTLVALVSAFQRPELYGSVMAAPDGAAMYRVLRDAFAGENA